ncbi:zinc finger BED domain-containing 4-like protein [Labeo rohita]|uniref:Zinc finger BED domain-containing 4-like protein n=1 Tax=Labeo rohita TaxID=84645 RepID=A0A498MS67_LABRO|nr:zinc finger BED domain-containing 4-like protein [Labeo rohita]RXN22713.1 zinc finger BED domain-containing 4-like protein [Labeo rohita]
MSAVWTYFSISEKDPRIAICKTCNAEISRGGASAKTFSTSGLIYHLKSKHPDRCAEYERNTAQKRKTPPSTPTPSVVDVFEKARKFPSDSVKAKGITPKIMELIALDDQPFSVVEDVGFCRLIEHIEPRYAMPSRRHFLRDIWSSDFSLTSMLSLTAQWIDADFQLQKSFEGHIQQQPVCSTPGISTNLKGMLLQMTSSTTQQLDGYLSEVPIPRSDNPLVYWKKKNHGRFPDLAKMARKYLSAPCTSTDSERLFSAAAHVLDEKRNRLHCDKAEKLLFIKKNLPLYLRK